MNRSEFLKTVPAFLLTLMAPGVVPKDQVEEKWETTGTTLYADIFVPENAPGETWRESRRALEFAFEKNFQGETYINPIVSQEYLMDRRGTILSMLAQQVRPS